MLKMLWKRKVDKLNKYKYNLIISSNQTNKTQTKLTNLHRLKFLMLISEKCYWISNII